MTTAAAPIFFDRRKGIGMHYAALACDYDGTLATDGAVDAPTLAALGRLRAAGRQILLVTGRELGDLRRVCSRLDLFDLVVAENGGLLYHPGTRQERTLGPPPPAALVAALRAGGAIPLGVGRVILATRVPYDAAVREAIAELGLDLEVIYNKGAVMVLPAGIDKAFGLRAGLRELGLAAHRVVGVGDAENDLAFLAICGYAAVVANALPALRERVDLVMPSPRGAGVADLIERMLAGELTPPRSHRA
jgi:hydroxymethylpyrimidine pyrophosphatase-like HAD family hydrolase